MLTRYLNKPSCLALGLSLFTAAANADAEGTKSRPPILLENQQYVDNCADYLKGRAVSRVDEGIANRHLAGKYIDCWPRGAQAISAPHATTAIIELQFVPLNMPLPPTLRGMTIRHLSENAVLDGYVDLSKEGDYQFIITPIAYIPADKNGLPKAYIYSLFLRYIKGNYYSHYPFMIKADSDSPSPLFASGY